MDPFVALERLAGYDSVASLRDHVGQRLDIFDEKGGMGIGRRTEVGLDPEMDLDRTPLEPAATAGCERLRLGNMLKTKQLLVERNSISLATLRHGQLYMIDPLHGHGSIMASAKADA